MAVRAAVAKAVGRAVGRAVAAKEMVERAEVKAAVVTVAVVRAREMVVAARVAEMQLDSSSTLEALLAAHLATVARGAPDFAEQTTRGAWSAPWLV